MKLVDATVLLVASIFMTSHVAMAEIKTFSKEYTYEAGELDSKVTSRFNALEQAKRLLLEELGIFLTSRTEVTNSQLTKDEITSLTAGIVSAVVLDEKWDGHKYWLKAKIDADPSVVQQAIEVIRGDYKKTKDLEQAQKRIEQLTKDLEAVKSDLASNPQDRQKRYTKIVNQKQSMDWVVKFFNLFSEKKTFAENKEAFDAINKAIEIDPEYLVPYVMRAALYGEVAKDYQKAIVDMTTAIKYFAPGPNNPYENTAILYESIGKYYMRLNKLQLAMGNFMTALEVDPIQILRSHSEYEGLDINIFIKKFPKDYRSYVIRARFNSFFESKSDNSKVYDNSITDIKKALKLNDKNPITFFILTEALVFKAMWNDSKLYNKVDTVSHNAIVEASSKGLNLATSKEWKNRFLSRRAQEYLVLKKYREAITDYNSRISLYPDYAGSYHDRAIAYKELGEYDSAIRDLTQAIGMKHDSINWPQTAYEVRASVYEAMNKYKEAVEDYSSAFNIWEKAFGKLNREHKMGSGVAYSILENSGNARRKFGDYAKAIEDYRSAISWMEEFHPHMIYGEIGDTYLEMKMPAEAIVEFDKAIARNAKQHEGKFDGDDILGADYYRKKASAYLELDQVNNAIDCYNKALKAVDNLPPYKADIYFQLGMLYQQLGINQEALKCYRYAVSDAEFNGIADFLTYNMLAHLELDSNNQKEAFQVFNKMIKNYPKSTGAYVARGSAYLSIGKYKEAITDLNKAVEILPTNSHAYFNRAVAYIKLDQNEKGTNDLRISARLGNKDAQQTLKDNNLDW